jgi:predicted RNase H-like HicB family nuclease
LHPEGLEKLSHYIAVLVPQPGGGWRAHFPDFPGCRADGPSVEIAIANARRAVADVVGQPLHEGITVPRPRSYEELRPDNEWAAERGIDWSTAVISLVPIEEHR